MMDKNNITAMAVPFAALILFMIFALNYKFKPVIRPLERQLQSFSYTRTQIIYPKEFEAITAVDSPIIYDVPRLKFPQVPLAIAAPKPLQPDAAEGKKVSMVIINGGRKTAIINGIIVSEGDALDGARVEKIERNGVLIRSAISSRWIGLQ
jgi:hypothetical protein